MANRKIDIRINTSLGELLATIYELAELQMAIDPHLAARVKSAADAAIAKAQAR